MEREGGIKTPALQEWEGLPDSWGCLTVSYRLRILNTSQSDLGQHTLGSKSSLRQQLVGVAVNTVWSSAPQQSLESVAGLSQSQQVFASSWKETQLP